MTVQKIIEGNKLIADFMGLEWQVIENLRDSSGNKFSKKGYVLPDDCEYGGMREFVQSTFQSEDLIQVAIYDEYELKFDSSWDWLMPVCKKIASENEVMQYKIGELISGCEFEIPRVFKAVVEHIKRRKK